VASLRDTIRSNNKKVVRAANNGGLFETTADAASSAGLPASPITPLGAASLGTTADQAKMAGTPAAKTTALRESTGAPSLREAIREDAAQKGVAAKEKSSMAGAQSMSLIAPGLEDRVQAIANAKIAAASTAAPVIQAPKVDPAKVASAFPGVDASKIDTALANLTNAPTTEKRQAAIDLANLLGVEPPTETTDLNLWVSGVEGKLAPILGPQASEIAKGAANAVADYGSITMEEVFTDPSFASLSKDIDAMATALGYSREELFKLNLDSFENALNRYGVDNLSQVQDLVVKANDPFTPPAERSALRQELRRLGASGVRATEQDYQSFQKDIESSKVVSVGGKDMTLADALSDERISKEVLDYIGASDENRRAFQAANPDLAAFADANKAVLSKAADSLKAEFGSLGESVASQLKSGVLSNGTTFSNTSLKKLFPELGSYGSSIPKPVTDFLTNLGRAKPEVSSAIDAEIANGTLSMGEANRVLSMGAQAQEAYAANPKGFKDWLAYADDFDRRLSGPEGAVLAKELAKLIAPSLASPFGARETNRDLAGSNDPLNEFIFDSNGDNVVDSWADVASRMKAWTTLSPMTKLEDVLKGRGEDIRRTRKEAEDRKVLADKEFDAKQATFNKPSNKDWGSYIDDIAADNRKWGGVIFQEDLAALSKFRDLVTSSGNKYYQKYLNKIDVLLKLKPMTENGRPLTRAEYIAMIRKQNEKNQPLPTAKYVSNISAAKVDSR
jgi:hypothetical protein